MTETLEQFQKEFDEDMNALEALSKQVDSCQAVIDVIKKMPENNAWVVVGVGVGSEKPDAEINLRGLDCDGVAALLAVTNATMCTLKKAIGDIYTKYPNLGDGETSGPVHKVENHYHYHFHERPPHHGYWSPNCPVPPVPSCPPDDEPVGPTPSEPSEPAPEPEPPVEGGDGVGFDPGDEPDPDTGEEPLAYCDGGWGKTSDEYDKYKDSVIETDSGLNLG